MRIIANIHSDRAAQMTGWRAKAVQVNEKREAELEKALKAVALVDGGNLYDYITKKDRLSCDWLLFVNGIRIPVNSALKRTIKDNVQIHLIDNPQITPLPSGE
jgi:hypothetical protein